MLHHLGITLHHLGITLHHMGIIDPTVHPIMKGVDHQGLNRGMVTAQILIEMGGVFLLVIDLNLIMEQKEDHQTGLSHQTIGLSHQTTGLSQDPLIEDMAMTDPLEGIPKIDMATTMPKVCHVHRCHHIHLP